MKCNPLYILVLLTDFSIQNYLVETYVTPSASYQFILNTSIKFVQGRECFKCGGRGHLARDCLEEPVSNNISDFCLRCGDSGHHMFICQSDYSSEDLKVRVPDG